VIGPRPNRLPVVLLVLVQAALFGIDALTDLGIVLTPATAVPVVVMALVAGPRTTLVYGVASVGLVIASGVLNDTLLDGQTLVRTATVGGASAVAVLASAGRRRLEEDVGRLALLATVADDVTTGRTPASTARSLLDALVPSYADAGRVVLEAAHGRPLLEVQRSVGVRARSRLQVPLRIPGGTIGTLYLSRAAGRPRFTRSDHRFARALAARIGLSMENARLVDDLTVAEADQRHVAQALQQSLRPPALPEIPGAALASFYRAVGEATSVGGDFYDVYPLGDGWLLVIGDVTGKGAEAASVTALARGALEATATETGSSVAAVARLDQMLGRRAELSLCSVACVHLHPHEDGLRAEVLLAGHPPVLLLRDGEVRSLGRPGPLPGAFPPASWTVETEIVGAGDVLVLRTDGATDAVGADGRLGEARLQAALQGLDEPTAQTVVDLVRATVDDHTVGDQRDDIAVLALAVGTPARTVHVDLDGTPACVAVARRAVEEHLAQALGEPVLADVRLLVSELVTNAVRHGEPGAARLTLAWDPRIVRAMIVDRGAGFDVPEPRLPGDEPDAEVAEGGYGLGLVQQLAARWGVDDDGGTRVWFEVDRA